MMLWQPILHYVMMHICSDTHSAVISCSAHTETMSKHLLSQTSRNHAKKIKNKTKICPLSYLATSAGRSVIQDARLQTVFSMWLANTTNDAFKRGEE